MFDDGRASSYTEGYTYMATKGLLGTNYVITNSLDQANYITTLQAQEMNTAGWDIGNHTTDHTTLAGLSAAVVAAKCQGAETALNNAGMTRASKHLAFPNGGYDDTAIANVQAAGMLTARTIEGIDLCPAGAWNSYRIPCRMTDNTTTLATVQGWITTAVNAGKCVAVLFHGIVAGAPTQYDWTPENFQALIDWIVAQGIPTYRITDLYGMR